jgi:hypothetical protein
MPNFRNLASRKMHIEVEFSLGSARLGISRTWDHPDKTRRMGRNARIEYEAKYTAERNHEMLPDLYQRVLTNARLRHS